MTRPSWLNDLVGTELRDAFEVEVHFAKEEPLTTGDLVLETTEGWFQILGVAPGRALRAMKLPNDVKLVGDWSDRSGVVLRPTGKVDVPFRIARVDYVQRGDALDGDATLGAWLIGDADTVRIGILLDVEDAQIGPPKLVWDHLAAHARETQRITLFGKR
jgi:hypothetical protein